MKIGEKPVALVVLAVIVALAGIGVLSMAYNYRDFAYYLATNMMNYKKQISTLEAEANRRSEFIAKQRNKVDSLQRLGDSLGWRVKSLEMKIDKHKLSFKREVEIDLQGYGKEITVQRDWEWGSSLIKNEKTIARMVIHDFVDFAEDTTFPDSYRKFRQPGSPWYIDKLLNRLDYESLIITGGGADCLGIPLQMSTWVNGHQVVITKVDKNVRCGDQKSGGTRQYEYWLGAANDSSRWIMSLKPETSNLSRMGLGVKYLERMLDSLALQSYYIN